MEAQLYGSRSLEDAIVTISVADRALISFSEAGAGGCRTCSSTEVRCEMSWPDQNELTYFKLGLTQASGLSPWL
jgi:hypothetical protein